jgi:hypothetical protein
MTTLNKFFAEIFVISFCINLALYLFGTFNVLPGVRLGYTDLTTWQGWFSLDIYSILFSAGTAGLIGVTALLLRNGTFAVYAMLITALGMIITPVKAVVTAIPTLIASLIPNSANPLPPVNGVYPMNPIVAVINAIVVLAAFWFFFGLVIQRDV